MEKSQSKPVKTKVRQKTAIPIKIKNYRDGKKVLHSIPKQGKTFDTCASKYNDYICCNVKVLKAVSNCPFDCTYCFLQNYLSNGTTTFIDDTNALMEDVYEKCKQQPWRFFRIGTWELGDSLALENETGQAAKLVQAFSKLDNVVLELKTKSNIVESLLNLDHNGKTVVSWSLNTAAIINTEEHKTASLTERLTALKKVADAGYLIGLHFDPMIYHDNWESGYTQLIDAVFDHVSVTQIAWISIGSLRFNPEQKRKMENNFPGSKMYYAEMVEGNDNKVRYVKPLRLKMYQHLYDRLQYYKADTSLLYFCMERWDVWDTVFGYSPDSIGHLDFLFADSMRNRFPHLNITPPKRAMYELFQDS